jgi:hypothetical protein
MDRVRDRHTTVLLSNGQVLAAGGDANAEPSSEMYSPDGDSWLPGAMMTATRYGHAAVRLVSGKVLACGGDSGNSPSAEVYDPSLGIWTATNPMDTARYGHTAVLLRDQKVLACGGHDSIAHQTTASAERFTEESPCHITCFASGAPESGFAPLLVQFSATVLDGGCSGPVQYAWDLGDGATSTIQNPSHTYAGAGTYRWRLTATLHLASCSAGGTVTVLPRIPGDCDGDGTVSIGEVQKAINMFLGLIPPDCGVDCNGDGAVSIGEVQKVINGFLGLQSAC